MFAMFIILFITLFSFHVFAKFTAVRATCLNNRKKSKTDYFFQLKDIGFVGENKLRKLCTFIMSVVCALLS